MRLEHFEITGLHGRFNYALSFERQHHGLSVLLGVNGSGKTAILSLLSIILDQNREISELERFVFKKIALTFSTNEQITVLRRRDNKIEVTPSSKEMFADIRSRSPSIFIGAQRALN